MNMSKHLLNDIQQFINVCKYLGKYFTKKDIR